MQDGLGIALGLSMLLAGPARECSASHLAQQFRLRETHEKVKSITTLEQFNIHYVTTVYRYMIYTSNYATVYISLFHPAELALERLVSMSGAPISMKGSAPGGGWLSSTRLDEASGRPRVVACRTVGTARSARTWSRKHIKITSLLIIFKALSIAFTR